MEQSAQIVEQIFGDLLLIELLLRHFAYKIYLLFDVDLVLTQELFDGLGLLLYYLLTDVGLMLDSSLSFVHLHGCLAALGLSVVYICVDQLSISQHFIGGGVIIMRIFKFFLTYVRVFT